MGSGQDSPWELIGKTPDSVSRHNSWRSRATPWVARGRSDRRQLVVPPVGSLPPDAWVVLTVGRGRTGALYPSIALQFSMQSQIKSGMDTHACPSATQAAKGRGLCPCLFSVLW